MSDYKLVDERIIENKTSNTVYSGKELYKMLDKLNSGTGFSGWTPDFFCDRISL